MKMPHGLNRINFFRPPRQRAQGLVEFALALPILLMLVFGIIELGRLLQAWLALENGARFGVRYAITGNYNPAYCEAAARALRLEDADLSDGQFDCRVRESFSTDWEDMQNALQDWARLPSIRDAALAGATGIAWDPAPAVSGDYLAYLRYGWNYSDFDMVNRGNPALKGYFNITVCSNRIQAVGSNQAARFQFNPNPRYFVPNDPNRLNDYRFPDYCERVRGTIDAAGNFNPTGTERYVDDAGGPGDRVRVVLTYRHELITPFLNSWWPTLRLQAMREGIVEKFRTSRVTGLTGSIGMAATFTPTPPPTATNTPTTTPTFTPTPVFCENNGSVLRQWWTGIGGTSLNDLVSNPRYPGNATGFEYLSSFEGPRDWTDNYGTRMRAYLCAPWTGDYTFYIASDDSSVLYLSNSTNPAGAAQIAGVNGWTNFREWNKYTSQRSNPIRLQAGQLYYIEALHKEGGGGDNLSVGWTGPGITEPGAQPVVIDGRYLVPLTPEPTFTPTPTSLPRCEDLVVTGEPLSFQTFAEGNPGQGYVIQSNLQNTGPYRIFISGALIDWNGRWYNPVHTPPAGHIFNYYAGSSVSQPIFDPPNVSTYPFGHAFTPTPSRNLISPYSSGFLRWVYGQPTPAVSNFSFWMLPNFNQYPPIPPGTPTPRMTVTPINWFGATGAGIYHNFYWASDFTGSIYYNVVPTVGPTLSCVQQVSGFPGPSIQVIINPGGTPFSVRAIINGNDTNVDPGFGVYFFVYDSAGNLVHWSRDTNTWFCIFGHTGSGSNMQCTTRRPLIDSWDMGGGVIRNGNYTLVVLARNNDASKKSNVVVVPFVISVNTPTPTPLPTSTFTPTITRTFTRTFTPGPTRTNTPIPSITQTPTVTMTRTITRTPTVTRTPTITLTPTDCGTPWELGGCNP